MCAGVLLECYFGSEIKQKTLRILVYRLQAWQSIRITAKDKELRGSSSISESAAQLCTLNNTSWRSQGFAPHKRVNAHSFCQS